MQVEVWLIGQMPTISPFFTRSMGSRMADVDSALTGSRLDSDGGGDSLSSEVRVNFGLATCVVQCEKRV